MALQGDLTWKGIVIQDAYVVIDVVSDKSEYNLITTVTKEAVLNDDGTVKTPEERSTDWVKTLTGSYFIKTYKDAASKIADPLNAIYSDHKYITPKVNNSAKNYKIQAYEDLKTLDAYKDLGSV